MRFLQLLAVVAATAVSPALAQAYKGFNYGASFSDGKVKQQKDFEGEFTSAKNMQYTAGTFTSARLFTIKQGNTANPISAIPAAINTKTSLLLGLWASAGQNAFNQEVAALQAAIQQYGTAFANLVVGISVGSEDLYRDTVGGKKSNAGPGASPATLISYINQVRAAIKGTTLANKPVGHVDTYNDYLNSSNSKLITQLDFIGVDAYPYYESVKDNTIDNAANLFFDDLAKTKTAAQGKPIWVTETGWPISSKYSSGKAVASPANAGRYYKEVGCKLFSSGYNTWWFILQDQQPVTPAIVFGVAGPGNPPPTNNPAYSLAC